MQDTIFALSSGPPPAAIAVVRISGPRAGAAISAIAGRLPPARTASLRTLRDGRGDELDEALVLWFPGPATATGEDCGEVQCHGGRAVVAAVRAALAALPGLREAEAGEFTRRAFANGRIDLAQAEALGELLAAETELQRRIARGGMSGLLSVKVEGWRGAVLELSAMVEAVLDFADEEDAALLPADFDAKLARLREDIEASLAGPRTERLRDGLRVVVGGPPNVGKSSLFNVLVGECAAIVASEAGTTRDFIERPIAIGGIPFVLVDTAGLRGDDAGELEAIGIARAQDQLRRADIVIWLGEEGWGPRGAVEVQPRCDDPAAPRKHRPDHVVSSVTSTGLAALKADLARRGSALLPIPGDAALNARQAGLLEDVRLALSDRSDDPLLLAESLRLARVGFDRLLGRSGIEEMLDVVFAKFCIGK